MQTSPSPRGFPFRSYPKGWFVVALSEDVAPGEVVRLHYFGRDLVLYRGTSGQAFVTEAYCPHLGAHLGHGGTVQGDTLRCPFHGWKFEGDGRCAEVPYSDKIPPKARLDAFPVREMEGAVHVYFDPHGGAPPALETRDWEGWTKGRTIVWRNLKTHAQEVFENTVDTAHIGPIHDGRDARIVGKPAFDGATLRIDIAFLAPGDIVGMPDQINDVRLHVTMCGLGWVLVETRVENANVDARQRLYVTPVDEETVDIRGIVHVREGDDAAFTDELARLFYQAFVDDFAKDFPIWENKRYVPRPLLAKGDGPIGLYRRWCTQFYEPSAGDSSSVGLLQEERDIAPRFSLDGLRRRLSDAALALVALRRKTPTATASRPTVDAPPVASTPSSRASESAAPRVASVTEYFDTLGARFVPSAAAGLDAVFQWEISGDGGGVFHARVANGALSVAEGPHSAPTVSLVVDAPDYVRIVNGEMDGVRAFATGRAKIKGSVSAAMKMRSLFPARTA